MRCYPLVLCIAIVVIMKVCAINLLFGFYLNQTQKMLLPKVEWKVGDWFEVKISFWKGYSVAMDPDFVDWDEGHIERFEVKDEAELYGYSCFVLEEATEGIDYRNRSKYFFRKSDMVLIAVYGGLPDGYMITLIGSSPVGGSWIGLWPSFPVYEGVREIPFEFLRDAEGKKIEPRYDRESHRIPPTNMKLVQKAEEKEIILNGQVVRVIQIEAEGYVCRWIPGQIWWAQCWELPRKFPQGRVASKYRASLYRTSRDGLLNYPLPKAEKGGKILE